MSNQEAINKAAKELFDEVFEQIEVGALDQVLDQTYPGGWEALEDASPSTQDAHLEATVRLVLVELARLLTERAQGGPS